MANGSTEARDLSLFQSEEPRLRAVNSSEKVKENQAKKEKQTRIVRIMYTSFIGLLLVASLVLMIVLNAYATEMDDKHNELTEQLAILQSEESRLRNEQAELISPAAIDQYIDDKQMTKTDANQIVPITVDGGDKIVVSDPEPEGIFETIGAAIAGWFGG